MLLQRQSYCAAYFMLLSSLTSFIGAEICDCGFGYELIQQRLDSLETKLLERSSNVIESCLDATRNTSGIYRIKPLFSSKPFHVYCDMSPLAGGWTVIQYRYNGVVNFTKTWQEYRDGFGILGSEYWMGLERIHQLTTNDTYELIVFITTTSGDYAYVHYSELRIDGEQDEYKLSKLGSYSGTAGDHLRYHEGRPFSTYDTANSCATAYKGGWWYDNCFKSNLNGQYSKTDKNDVVWGLKNPTNYSKMMIRKK